MTREESILFYKEHAKRLYNISLRIVGDSPLAEEIMQDTILKYMSLNFAPAFASAWLSKTCIRASIDALRRRKRERLFLDEYAADHDSDYSGDVDDSFSGLTDTGSAEIAKVRDAIESLKDPYRLVLNLILIEGLDYEEISGFTGENEGTIRTQYSRARKMLAAKLTRRNVSELL